MAYGKLLFNNFKEYTPHYMKTVPFARTVKPVLGRGKPVGYALNKTKSMMAIYRAIDKVFMSTPAGWNILLFGLTYGLTALFFVPVVTLYRRNNAHRSLDRAIERERVYLAKKKAEEDEEDEDDEDDEDEEDEEDEE